MERQKIWPEHLILRGYSQTFEVEEGIIKLDDLVLWLQYDYYHFISLPVVPGNQLALSVDDAFCKECYQPAIDLDNGLCDSCYHISDYQKCIYNAPDACLNQMECVKEKPACGDPANVKLCFAPYVLYIARFGNLQKVGISKKYRKGKYYSRLVEQGANEAMVVHGFKSLPEVAKAERWLQEQCGFQAQASHIDKVRYSVPEPYSLKPLYEKLLPELFPDAEIEHLTIFKDQSLQPYEPSFACLGKVMFTQGPFIAMTGDTDKSLVYLNQLMDHRVEELQGIRLHEGDELVWS